jgi:hypothetical protein
MFSSIKRERAVSIFRGLGVPRTKNHPVRLRLLEKLLDSLKPLCNVSGFNRDEVEDSTTPESLQMCKLTNPDDTPVAITVLAMLDIVHVEGFLRRNKRGRNLLWRYIIDWPGFCKRSICNDSPGMELYSVAGGVKSWR